MTDFEKLMQVLKVDESQWNDFLSELCAGNLQLVLDFKEDGTISWGTLN